MTIIKEEVDLAQYVERGLVGVNVDAVRDNINTYLNGTLGKCFVTPYIALERVRKVLANFHIFLPRTTFLEGDRGVEVFDIKQFGEVMGMRDDGTVVTKVSDPYSLYFEYKMNSKGMFEVFAEIVTKDELDDLMSAVEDDMNDEDAEDDREEKLDEESKSDEDERYQKFIKGRRIAGSGPTPVIKASLKRKIKGPGSATVRRKDKDTLRLRGEKLDEVTLAGPETGPKRITGQPDYGMTTDYDEDCGCEHDDEKPKMKIILKKKELAEEQNTPKGVGKWANPNFKSEYSIVPKSRGNLDTDLFNNPKYPKNLNNHIDKGIELPMGPGAEIDKKMPKYGTDEWGNGRGSKIDI